MICGANSPKEVVTVDIFYVLKLLEAEINLYKYSSERLKCAVCLDYKFFHGWVPFKCLRGATVLNACSCSCICL